MIQIIQITTDNNNSMSWFKLTNKKDLEREELKKEVEVKVAKLLETKEKRAIAQKNAFARFNRVAEEYGRDGIWFLILGGEERKR